jgi:O-antigen ligase
VYLLSTLIVGIFGIYDFFTNYNKGDIMYILNNARVKSTLPHPNAYGAYLILAIFPTLTIALQSKGKERWAYLSLSILLSINLALTFSRNGWLALAIGILLLTVVYNWKFIFLCIIPAAYVAISPAILTRIRQLSDSGLNEGRLRLWKMSEKMISENLFFGVGSGNFPAAYKDYVKRFPELKIVEAETLPPHNSYIRAFSELGIFGAMIFLLLCLEMLKTVYSIKDKFSGIIQKFYSGYLISVVCFFIMNCFDDLFFSPKVTFNFMFFVSMAYSIRSTKEINEENTLESASLI